jgi:hypothetical protein
MSILSNVMIAVEDVAREPVKDVGTVGGWSGILLDPLGLKIVVCGGILTIAVLVLTFAAYKIYMAKFREWQRKREIEAYLQSGGDANLLPDEPVVIKAVSSTRMMMFATGGLALIAGLAFVIMP